MSEDYRHKEADCRHWAKATDDVVLKMNLLEIADTWKNMAESAERIAKTPHPKFRFSARQNGLKLNRRGHYRPPSDMLATSESPGVHRRGFCVRNKCLKNEPAKR